MAAWSFSGVTKGAHIVIGSGPAGVSAAMALLARGRTVVMVDGGKVLDGDAAQSSDGMAADDPGGWTAQDRDGWMAPQFATPPGQVRRYGSDFAMEPGAETMADLPGWFALRASRAAGGLSNLWGSAVLPYTDRDMAGWPVTAAELAPHYRAVAGFLPVAGIADALAPLLPEPPMAGRQGIEPSPQARELLSRMARRGDALARMGVTAGQARQAVDTGCRLCGLCLHGCPYGLIWKAGDTLANLRQHPGFSYRPGAVVTRIDEGDGAVILHLEGGRTIRGARAYLGAGVLETARILLASQPGLGELTLRDSQHAFLPMLHRWANRTRPDRGRFHTLPQAFVEIDAPAISPHLIHSQLYTWNEFFPRDLIENYASKIPFSAPLFAALARRLIVAQMFLHSDHSHRIALRLAADGRLSGRLETHEGMEGTLKAAARHMGRAMSKLGLLPLSFATRPGAPGSSFHVGASVPMAAEPKAGQSDPLGRPLGWERLHLIDASSLPAIPATTITYSVMANAHRIGALSD